MEDILNKEEIYRPKVDGYMANKKKSTLELWAELLKKLGIKND